METTELRFHLREYLSYWKDFGIEALDIAPEALLHQMQTQTTTSSTQEPPRMTSLKAIREWLGDCQRCGLANGRKSIVFGSGKASARLMFVGEGPGRDEDVQGLPFVGRAGKLLTKIIQAMGYDREEVYIANTVKCRPPQNRTPLPDEMEQCFGFLKAQIQVIKPEVVVALGLPASQTLLNANANMGSLRGRFHKLHWNDKILVMPTYHPAYLLRNPNAKGIVWRDMKIVKNHLEGSH